MWAYRRIPLQPKTVEFNWQPEIVPFHPNGMKFEALTRRRVHEGARWLVYSVGGWKDNGRKTIGEEKKIYEHASTIGEIMNATRWNAGGQMLGVCVKRTENRDIGITWMRVWKTMQKCFIHEGLETDGVLPGELGLRRAAFGVLDQGEGYKQSPQSRCLVMIRYAGFSTECQWNSGYSSYLWSSGWCRLSCISFQTQPFHVRPPYPSGACHCRFVWKYY